MSASPGAGYYYRRLQEEISSGGVFRMGSLFVRSALKKGVATNSSIWYRFPLSDALPLKNTSLPVAYDLMNFEEAKRFFEENNSSFPWMYIEPELDAATQYGHMFPCLRLHGKVVAYQKIGLSKAYVLDFQRLLTLPPGTTISYDAFVEPSYRGKGLGTSLLSLTAHYLKQAGYRIIWAQIPSWNVTSANMTRSAGFIPLGEVRYIRLLGKEMFFKRPRTLPLHFARCGPPNHELKLEELSDNINSVSSPEEHRKSIS
jgi:GNAT superfamily N-acetyltransferase